MEKLVRPDEGGFAAECCRDSAIRDRVDCCEGATGGELLEDEVDIERSW